MNRVRLIFLTIVEAKDKNQKALEKQFDYNKLDETKYLDKINEMWCKVRPKYKAFETSKYSYV